MTIACSCNTRLHQLARGECLCSCGQLLHGAREVTSGVRYVAVCFIEEEFECAPQSAARGKAIAQQMAAQLDLEAEAGSDVEASDGSTDDDVSR